MLKRLRPIGHDDRLSVVDHLDELRSRLIICAAALVVVFAVCFWQNSRLLNFLNAPLKHLSTTARDHISGLAGDQAGERRRSSRRSATCNCSPTHRLWPPATGR